MKYNVFLNHPNPTGATPDTDPHYVGTVGMFALQDHAAHSGMNMQVNLTRTVARLRQEKLLTRGQLKVQVVPVLARGVGNARAGGNSNVELTVGRIRILTR